jgi:dolichyl-phosphate beta-glucosyltransferase
MAANSLSIVVPVFNEERRLPAFLEQIGNDADSIVSQAGLQLEEVVVVDDGSTDGTPALLEGFQSLPGRFRWLQFDRNRGKGAAVRAGMLSAVSAFGLMTDVDLSTPLEEVALLRTTLDAGSDVAIASRALEDSQVLVHQPFPRELMGKAFNLGLRILLRVPWHDTQCGFKLFRLSTTRELFERQRVDGFAFDVELLVMARRLGLGVEEVPVRWIDNPDTRVGMVSGSTRMALDTLRIAYWSRRPLTRLAEPTTAALQAGNERG